MWVGGVPYLSRIHDTMPGMITGPYWPYLLVTFVVPLMVETFFQNKTKNDTYRYFSTSDQTGRVGEASLDVILI